MTETGWQAIGRIARKRRERLRLRQDELAHYKGPKVATVGKFERAAQENFPPRTQQKMEAALGWPDGTIRDFVAAWESPTFPPSKLHDWGKRLVDEDLPDTRRPDLASPTNLSGLPQDSKFENYILVLRSMLSIVPLDRQGAAMLAATSSLATPRRKCALP